MSEKIELIEAKDLPVTERENVTVLCVDENGEMVRKDAGSFGMKMSELAELPTTEAEEVDVICADAEGNMCRKSSASFGGGGYILKPTVEEIAPGENGMIITADCTDMVKAIETGANVMILLPAGGLGEGAPALLFTIVSWGTEEGTLMGLSEFGFTFPNAPIPSFLQG